MQLTTIIDVALGLILLYLVLSLVCTTINEFIAALLKLRARNLASTIEKLIDDKNVRSAFYSHGLIISSALSSRAGMMRADDTTNTKAQVGKHARPTYLDGQTVARALLDSLKLLDPAQPDKIIDGARGTIEQLPDSTMRKVMLANLDLAGTSVEQLRLATANWFDSAMDRLSGSYNRQLKAISFGVGLILAVAINADSLTISRAIWSDDALKGQIEATSQQYVTGENASLMEPCASSASSEATSSASASEDPAAEVSCAAGKLGKLESQLRPFPLGWTGAEIKVGDGLWWLFKAIGLLWTAFALSLGAPFWFDLLQKIMSLRAAGSKPASSTDPDDGDGSGLAKTEK